MSLVVEWRSSSAEPAVALRGPLDFQGIAISLGSTLCLVSLLPHIFAGPEGEGPTALLTSTSIALL